VANPRLRRWISLKPLIYGAMRELAPLGEIQTGPSYLCHAYVDGGSCHQALRALELACPSLTPQLRRLVPAPDERLSAALTALYLRAEVNPRLGRVEILSGSGDVRLDQTVLSIVAPWTHGYIDASDGHQAWRWTFSSAGLQGVPLPAPPGDRRGELAVQLQQRLSTASVRELG
jgi:hypothetical protein